MGYGEFHYGIGDLVQVAYNAPVRTITARGWLLVSYAQSNRREDAYQLDDGHWDWYWAAELYPIGQAPRPVFVYTG
ncbi:hypothetical protein [Hymenobacter negativus]|uniref:Uncharacterized protein n=1 Tax=Hymenobacter negativus TaxID=2795026 RepID=A0ABS3QDG4_9BACT|nr:hypothetical protein [Hymenobacter negativus]MBO2009156.1 hypothetical protein [Hymenobacter negativus]